ncbi:cytochrome P450 CYP4/CYP19/CYP26 subfamilies [Diaporthe helianthi]|uniref:Cytochrome P450 CYP4/CYP19/CYP26 subfamilies n=1 Tax=Diaporthe helianthi TaxID=158607 RepID=A0A2P5HWQ7_DIAHE|nr:cytochrome P450 CYP4/CYP19/CYP26 subfamilies [Diaporthe helianthi]
MDLKAGQWLYDTRAIRVLLSIVLSVSLAWYLLGRSQRRRAEEHFAAQRGCLPPKTWNSTWPLGLDMLLKALKYARTMQILQFFLEVVDDNGTTFVQELLGATGIDTVDPENIEAILSTNFEDYGLGLRALHFKPLLGSGIFTQDGAPWKHSRALLRPQFASNRSQNFEQIKTCVQDLIDAIPGDGSTVDLQPLFFKLTFDTTMFLLFGDSVLDSHWGAVAGQESSFAQAFNLAQDYLAHRGRLGQFYWLLNDRTFRDACRRCHRFVDEAVAKALRPGGGGDQDRGKEELRSNYSFIDALAEQTQDKTVLRDQCFNVLLAGRDTTGCCLSWSMRLLARHPQVLRRLRDEVATVCGLGPGSPPPARDDLKPLRMPYLSLVVKEVLRLYPSVPVNSREAIRLTTLPVGGGGDGKAPILVRPGQAVGYCVYAMHRRKDIYGDDAEAFRPERWEEDRLRDVGWAYLPFNGGPRLCLGQDFALLEVSYTICRLVQVFPHIAIPASERHVDVGQERQTLTLVVASADGCRLSMGTEAAFRQ